MNHATARIILACLTAAAFLAGPAYLARADHKEQREYTIFIDLKPNNWTLIVSSWPAQTQYDSKNKTALWGSFGYTPDKDVVRAPMTLAVLPFSIDQLTWDFLDVTDAGGKIAIMWDKTIASVPFKTGS